MDIVPSRSKPAFLLTLRKATERANGYQDEVSCNVDSMIAARALYERVGVPVTLVYGEESESG